MSEKLRWGLIGSGDIAKKRIAPALIALENCELVGVARRRAELAREFADSFGIEKAFAGVAELVADKSIDAVYIASPVFLHCEHALSAAAAGKHVLCEKPLGLTSAESRAIVDACRNAGVTLGTAYYRRFYPVLARVRELIADGVIGKVALAQMNAFEYFDPPEDHPRRWLLDPEESGGGPMMDFGCHRIEVLTSIFGDVTSVSAFVSNAVFGREVEDTAVATFGFASGATATVTVTHAAFEARDTLDIYGTEGSLHIGNVNRGDLRIIDRDGDRTEDHPPHENLHLPLIDDFTRAVLEGRGPVVDGECGQMIARIEDEIYGRA